MDIMEGDFAVASTTAIRARIRLDFRGTGKSGKFFFKGRSVERAAEDAREQSMAMFKNVPIQGIYIQDVDLGLEVYTVYDEITNAEVSFAPVVLDIVADSLESLVTFIAREDFRKIEILSPNSISLQRFEMERLMFKVYEEIKLYRSILERKYNLR